MVLPAFGGETMSARCPFPSGAIRSSTRVTISRGPCSSLIRSTGSMLVEIIEVREPRRTVHRALVHGVDPLDQPLLPAHLSHRGEVLALPEPQLLHQVLGDLCVLRARQEVAPDLPQEGVRPLRLGVENTLHRGEVGLHLRRRRPRSTARRLLSGGGLLLLLLARLPLLQLLGGEEDLVLLPVRTGQHPVRLTLRGEEHRCAAPTPAPAAAPAARARLTGGGGGSTAGTGGDARRGLGLVGAIVVGPIVSVGVGRLRRGRGGSGVQGVVVVAHPVSRG